ncbi:sugar phosphate isomerase/epimerase family protein [uncultured Fibrella sp.]|uniref:sugar phosphate isomerase/epimerase family protein n=1 Tax=uncultured Fibrella sp. TaxID=1284596 RepID=UPI0035CB939B
MQTNRRDFLKQAGLLPAGAVALSSTLTDALGASIKTYGLQLYSVRDVLPADPKGIMTQLASMGYKQFESYQGDKGFLWGMEPAAMKSFLNGIGVKMVSTHFDFKGASENADTLQKYIDMANGAGLNYMLCPYIGPQKTWDDWKRVADSFNRVGEAVRNGGLKFGYHNHDYSFRPLDGKLPQDYLLTHCDPINVMFELDMCWIEAAGQSAVDHLKQYGSRYELCHIKDYKKEGNGKVVQQDMGKGTVNYKAILKQARKSGMKYYLIEQEEYPGPSMVSLKADADYMKKFKF